MKAVYSMKKSGRKLDPNDKVYWQLSIFLSRKHYETKLYADKDSAAVLLNDWKLEFDEIDLEVIERDTKMAHPMCWSAGKLAAIRDMASKREPFFHIDGDAFLFRPLPKKIENASMFCQCIERAIPKASNVYLQTTYYPINELLPMLHMPTWMQAYSRMLHQRVMNMGFFGGNDLETIHEFASIAIKTFVEDRHNRQAFEYLHRGKPHFLGIAAIAEQWAFGAYCHFKKLEPTTMMDGVGGYKTAEMKERGWGHLFSIVRQHSDCREWACEQLALLCRANVEMMEQAA